MKTGVVAILAVLITSYGWTQSGGTITIKKTSETEIILTHLDSLLIGGWNLSHTKGFFGKKEPVAEQVHRHYIFLRNKSYTARFLAADNGNWSITEKGKYINFSNNYSHRFRTRVNDFDAKIITLTKEQLALKLKNGKCLYFSRAGKTSILENNTASND